MDMLGSVPAEPTPAVLPPNAELPNPSATPQVTGQTPDAAAPEQAQMPDGGVQDPNVQSIQQACRPDPAASQNSSSAKKPTDSQKAGDLTQPTQASVPVFVPVTLAASVMNEKSQLDAKSGTQETQKISEPASVQAPAIPPEIQKAWADVKKFQFTVQADPSHSGAANVQPLSASDAQKEAIVTTDPIASVQLQQLPPRIIAIEKVVPEPKFTDRTKAGTVRDSADSSVTVPTSYFGEAGKTVDQIEQARPANPVEIPQTPHVPVVRTVAMEVGDADSQVTVRIQERSGDISLQFNAANDPLHHDLQSSVGSLVHALKQEQVQVSNVEVTRKAPIDKVRRMKETNS
jgi:hypothetical protein